MTLRDSRAAALKNIEELKEINHQTQSDLSLANQRLKLSKHTIQVIIVTPKKLGKMKKLMIMFKPHAPFQTKNKTSAKFQKDQNITIRGVVPTHCT